MFDSSWDTQPVGAVAEELEREELRVVAIDDEPGVTLAIVDLMTDFGFEIVGESDPRKAFALIKRLMPDVVILDIMMPLVDGYEIARQMSDDPSTSAIPVVYLTAKGVKNDLCRSFMSGGILYLKKPFLAEELADSLRIAVSLARTT